MVHFLDRLPATLPLWILPSASLSLIELMLQLQDLDDAPAVAAAEANPQLNWTDLVGQTFGGVTLRHWDGPAAQQPVRLAEELKAGRPAGLLLNEWDPVREAVVERGWALLRMNEIGRYIFFDAVRRHPESLQEGGNFIERRVLRFDEIPPASILAILYWYPLVSPVPFRRRGRPRKRPL